VAVREVSVAVVVAESLGLVVVLRAPFDKERERVVLPDLSAVTDEPALSPSGDVLSWFDDLVFASLQ
jgi:hypothetical protein